MSLWDKTKRVKQRLANILDIPKDVMLDLPKIVMVGNVQVFLENHSGIIEYTSNIIRAQTNVGEIRIEGNNLSLKNILPDEIVVEGIIYSLSFPQEEV
jgi:sporulation protein YqfC